MKITYDREVDALYIRLLEGDHQCRVLQLTNEVSLDLAEGEKLVGIEVLGASRYLEIPDRPTIVLDDLLASAGRR